MGDFQGFMSGPRGQSSFVWDIERWVGEEYVVEDVGGERFEFISEGVVWEILLSVVRNNTTELPQKTRLPSPIKPLGELGPSGPQPGALPAQPPGGGTRDGSYCNFDVKYFLATQHKQNGTFMTMQLDHSKSVMGEMSEVLYAFLSNTCKLSTADAQKTLAGTPVTATDTSNKIDVGVLLRIINTAHK